MNLFKHEKPTQKLALNDEMPTFLNIDLEHLPTRLQEMLDRHLSSLKAHLEHIEHYDWNNVIGVLESFDNELEKFWSPVAHLNAVMNTKALRTCYSECLAKLTAYEMALSHNEALYHALKQIDKRKLNKAQFKLWHDMLRDFELSGVALDTQDKKTFEEIETQLSQLSNQFENHILDATHAYQLHLTDGERIKGIPSHAVLEAKKTAEEKSLDGWVFNLEYPAYAAVVTYADDRTLRKEIYEAYVTRASDVGPSAHQFDNAPIMREILKLRHQKAKLLGYSHYASLSLATKMAESTDEVLSFLDDLIKKSHHQATKEIEQLKRFADESLGIAKLEPWDVAYAAQKKKEALFSIHDEALRPYFPLPRVMTGMMQILHELFGIHFIAHDQAEVWHGEVQCYAVVDEHHDVRGYLYLDLFARPHKRGGAWMDSCQSRMRRDDGTFQKPIAFLTCNFAKPAKGKVATLSHDEVLTLFHEMGHCLHHLLTKVEYHAGAGINGVEWDAVELPSQFLENWCWQPKALALMSAHVETGESLPETLLNNLIAARNFQSAMALMRQLEFSLFDFQLHLNHEDNVDFVSNTLDVVRKKTALIPAAPFNRFQNSFSHIFGGGYAAGYYSYKWAEVLAADAFSRFEEEGIFNHHTGRDFLHFILEVGGSVTAKEAFYGFRGRAPKIDALLRHTGIHK